MRLHAFLVTSQPTPHEGCDFTATLVETVETVVETIVKYVETVETTSSMVKKYNTFIFL